MKKKSAPQQKIARNRSRGEDNGHWISAEKFKNLQDRLQEAQETLAAIRSGGVDAVVVTGAQGNQIYSLAGADQPYRVYVEQMQEGAVTVSDDGLVLYCNQRFADMVKAPLEKVISSRIQEHLPLVAWKKLVSVFSSDGGVAKHQSLLHRPSAGALPVSLTANRLPLEQQNVMCLVVSDLTEQKEQEELRLAKEVAEKANETKDAFLAALSHELRTPLTPVLIATTSLEQDLKLPARARAELTMIRRNVELETRLIDDLLDLTRIARGKLEFHLGPLNIHLTIQRALEVCQADLDRKRHQVTIQLDASRTETEGDVVRLQQAFWNLISNALKFTPPGGTITIGTANPTPDSIVVTVSDTGPGFEPDQASKIFDAFEQGNRTVTRQFGGLGLGLAISRSIVESHDGTIRASSGGVGKGATFTLELPLRATTSRPSDAPTPADTNVSRKYSIKQILLVEDHNDTRLSLEMLLRKHKHEVKTASSAREALALAGTHKFDIVISDIGLPDRSGLELMGELRERFGLKGISLSGYGMEEDIVRSRAAGFIHHLVKPIRFDCLKQLISEMETTP